MTQNEAYLRSYYGRGYTSPFGDCRPANGNPCGRRHRGVDLSHSTVSGTQAVPALYSGTVVGFTRPNDGTGFGHGIKIRSLLGDGNYWVFHYAHGPWASSQKLGEWVEQGQIILHEGLSGFTSGPCVHVEQMREKDGLFTNARPEMNRVAGGGKDYGSAPAPAPAPAPANSSPNGGDHTPPAGEYNPFGIKWSKGIQKMIKHYAGYKGAIDAKWDKNGGSIKAFTQWLRNNWGYSGNDTPGPNWWKAVQRWLAASWGYTGPIDGDPGDGTKAALYRAESANYQQLS